MLRHISTDTHEHATYTDANIKTNCEKRILNIYIRNKVCIFRTPRTNHGKVTPYELDHTATKGGGFYNTHTMYNKRDH
jgi:hypothetical protein